MSGSTHLGHCFRANIALLAIVLTCAATPGINAAAQGQGLLSPDEHRPAPAGTPQSWVERAAQYELAVVQQDDLPLRYRIRKMSEKSDTTRVVIESEQGNVARLVERDGKPLTPAEDAAERSRLNAILQSPDAYLKHEKKQDEGRAYALGLIKLMPRAMIYSYAPGQPQPPGAASSQVVIDFHPDPSFKPPTIVSSLLTGLEGRMWLDARTGHMTRIQAHVLHPVNFGWGVIARVYPGGTLEFEQTCVAGSRWAYSHLEMNLTLREMMVRTVNDRTRMTAWDFEPLPSPLSVQAAVHALLALPVKPQ